MAVLLDGAKLLNKTDRMIRDILVRIGLSGVL